MMKKIIFIGLIVYIMMTSFTSGYLYNHYECFETSNDHSMGCSIGQVVLSTVWPVFWTYHSGSLLFYSDSNR